MSRWKRRSTCGCYVRSEKGQGPNLVLYLGPHEVDTVCTYPKSKLTAMQCVQQIVKQVGVRIYHLKTAHGPPADVFVIKLTAPHR